MKAGIERLETLINGQLDQALIKVVNYLKKLDIDDTIFINEEKDLKGMCDYVKGKAKEFAVNGVAVIIDETVYDWSLTYWQQSNEALGIKKEEPKPTPKIPNVVPKESPKPEMAQLTLF